MSKQKQNIQTTQISETERLMKELHQDITQMLLMVPEISDKVSREFKKQLLPQADSQIYLKNLSKIF